ncbi:MAG: sigma-70 family RNA polymerase sigma factor [Bacteroidales bacterium]|nr:sigma-70 family RNA polymerase sigma factor [Bacteroidales bacterium]
MAKHIQDIEKLIDGCLQQDRKAQYRLYELFAPAMLGVCCRYAPTKEEAEDIMIEGFASVFSSLSSFRHESSLPVWIRGIMVKTAINTFRAHKKFLMHDEISEAQNMQTTSSTGGDILTKLEAQQVLALVQEMPEDWRIIFNLRIMEEYSFKEIAEELGRNENTIRVYFQRARAWLLNKINEQEQ